jgi:hypothetical protein
VLAARIAHNQKFFGFLFCPARVKSCSYSWGELYAPVFGNGNPRLPQPRLAQTSRPSSSRAFAGTLNRSAKRRIDGTLYPRRMKLGMSSSLRMLLAELEWLSGSSSWPFRGESLRKNASAEDALFC